MAESSRTRIQTADVVIIGNGPSGICLSYFLSGYRPFYNGMPHPNEYLTERLQKNQDVSIVEQNLEDLSEGLEGRSSNPIALLLDQLLHPDADLGTNKPSLLEWKQDEKHAINHILLGKGEVGGVWQQLDSGMQTLSPGKWMEMPSMSYIQWLRAQKRHISYDEGDRANTTDVQRYLSDFVRERNLEANFKDYHLVTSVQKVFNLRTCAHSESGEVEPCCQNIKQNHKFMWEVRGHTVLDSKREEFCYQTSHVVLATGTYDVPNRLGVPGENLPHVVHSLPEFEKAVVERGLKDSIDPIVVVGAGLSAADIILLALDLNIPVAHVFRSGSNDPSLVLRKLPPTMYPEYHQIHSMMKGVGNADGLYKPYPKHKIVDFLADGKVLIERVDDNDIESIDSPLAAVMIGARPDLSFLPQDGRKLGQVQNWAIDSKHNPIQVDQFSYQCIHESGLYALGPLVGDNFVRFAVGGSLGITNHLWRHMTKA